MVYRPLKSPFYQDIQLGTMELTDLGLSAWKEPRADSLMSDARASDEVQKLAAQLSDRQSKTLLAALRRATELAAERKQPLVVEFWERQYNEDTSPVDSDRFVYVREGLPRVGSDPASMFAIAIQFS